MSYEIRPAKRGNAKPLIGIHALSGDGKTYSSLVLARGCVGPDGKIIMIETEEGRGESYADPAEYPEIGGYDVIPMRDSFSPRNYGEAIEVAAKAKPDALIIDSGSAEWSGLGGVLDMADKNGREGKTGLLQWQRPKMDHATYFLGRILQSPIPLIILCLRSKYPMVEKWDEKKGKKVPVRSDVLEPIQSEDILYEMFLHGWIDKEHRFHVGKITNKSLLSVFLDNQPVTPETGQRLAAWMAGRRAPEGSAGPAATTGPAAGTGPTGSLIALYGASGAELTAHPKLGEWLDALEELLKVTAGPDVAAVWEANQATFARGLEITAKNPEAATKFNAVGKLANELIYAASGGDEEYRQPAEGST